MDNFENPVDVVLPQEEKILVLRKPVSLGGVDYSEIVLREPTAGELSKATRGFQGIDTGIMLISLISKVPKGVVEKMCQRDFQEANDFLASFTPDGPSTGAT